MAFFTDRIFTFKGGYFFKPLERDVADYFLEELVYQVQDMEKRWLQTALLYEKPPRDPEQKLRYRLQLEHMQFRLQELLRFLQHAQGPKILEYICSEIGDMIQEKLLMETSFKESEVQQVATVLTVMGTYFAPEVFGLVVDVDNISERLREAALPLIGRMQHRTP